MGSTDNSPLITLRLLRQLKQGGKTPKVADSTGVRLNCQELLIRTLALRSYLKRNVLSDDESYVGVFLPPTVPGVAANLALSLDNRIAVNLNYTVSSDVLRECCKTAGLKHVITSRKFIDKVGLDPGCPMIFLEDIRERITIGDKLFALLNAKFRSAESLHRALGLDGKSADDPLTIIFTSGSTGVPKGVILSGNNITSNVLGIYEKVHLDEHDVVLGVLPFFHSFGFTVAIWTALCLPCKAVYHYSPLEARPIGKLAHEYGATVLLATPTFLRTYIRRIEKEQFEKLEVVVVGAEKMPLALFSEFEDKFGVRPVEGYGTTELSPVVAVNCPKDRQTDPNFLDLREGKVGRPYKGVEARVVCVDTDQELETGQAGLLEIRGPNVMQGYLNRPDLTAEVMHDDWYRTGDMAVIDEDGFIEITGRLSRFSKIGGEMVPHIQIEEVLSDIVGSDEEGTIRVAVSAVPDTKRGERLIVLYTQLPCDKSEVLGKLSEAGLPNIYLPSADSFYQVDAIPILGTGKLDLKGLKQLALDKSQAST